MKTNLQFFWGTLIKFEGKSKKWKMRIEILLCPCKNRPEPERAGPADQHCRISFIGAIVGSPGGWLQPRQLVSGSLGPLRNLVIWSRSVQNMFFEYSPDSFWVLPLAPKWGAPSLADFTSQTDRQASRNKYKMAAGGENWPSLNSVVWAKIRVKQFRGGDVNCSPFESFYSAPEPPML